MAYETKENWNKMAGAYDRFTQGPDTYSAAIEWPCVQGLLPALKGEKVLDLGCGAGRFTFLLEKMGANAPVGVDCSDDMLALAREKAEQRGSSAVFVQGDAGEIERIFPGESFDFVFSSTLTHFLSDLPGLFRQVHQLLRKGGGAVFSMIHPVYSAQYPVKDGERFPRDEEWKVRYLNQSTRAYVQPWIEYNPKIENFLTESYHHTFGDYINAITRAGFTISKVEEPCPPERWKREHPVRYEAYMQTPTYLIVSMRK